jgi:outer membrane scaffolding protein for murein synthesis (MipA/OmpV family)
MKVHSIGRSLFTCAVLALVAGLPVAVRAQPPADDEPQPRRSWDAAIGFIAGYAPEYAGSSRWAGSIKPGGWLRVGRVSISSRSSFVVRSSEPVAGGGLRLDLSPNERLRVGLGLRHDGGRQEGDSAELKGLGDVRRTVRMRLGASYPLDGGLRLGASISVDALGRGGGEILDINVSRGFSLAPDLSASLGAALTFGSRRHLQAYYGVNAEQAARSGYAVYTPGAGARDVSASAGLRWYFARDFVAFGGVSASRLVGPAAASPLVRERNSWGLSAGMAYRF